MPASLGAALGERFVAGGRVYYAAPTPERLAAAPLDAIRAAKLAYRDRYEEALAEAVMSATDLEALKQAPGDEAWRELMRLTGVALTPPTSRSSVPLAARMLYLDVYIRWVLSRRYFGDARVSEDQLRALARTKWGRYQAYAGFYLATDTDAWANDIGARPLGASRESRFGAGDHAIASAS